MLSPIRKAIALLQEAQKIYDSKQYPLRQYPLRQCPLRQYPLRQKTLRGWSDPFGSGAMWMRENLQLLRGHSIASRKINYFYLGMLKYGLCLTAASLFLILFLFTNHLIWLVVAVTIFYLIEAQWVFLFPLAIDGSERPFRESVIWTRKAGGTLNVMFSIIPLALVMILGGFLGRGFLRSWCLGCLAVLLWYEELRKNEKV